jgi:LacI family transcriptional regulator
MTRPPTLRDVAEMTGVSIKTISRFVNGSGPVAPATADRVEKAIEALGFRPNAAARSLRVGRDDAIGLVVENIADPFLAALTAAVEARMRDQGLFVIITSGGYDPRNERGAVESLVHRRVAGVVLTPTSDDHSYLTGQRPSVPVVFVDRPPTNFGADTVLVDNEGGVRTATDHLIAHGHRRIAFVGDRIDLFTTRLRYQGFRAALAAAGIPLDEQLVRTDVVDAATAARATRELLSCSAPPTAVLSANARTSLGVVKGIRTEGPPMVAHVCFDDFDGAESMSPPVTVVYQDPELMGRKAAELLLQRIAAGARPQRRIVLPTQLIVRGSGELPPCDRA